MLRRTLRRIAHDQRGLTLMEQLVSMFFFLLVMSAILGILDAANKAAPRDQERANSIQEAQTGLHRMVRELRQAERYTSLEAGSVTAQVRLPRDNPNTGAVETHSLWDVRYTCNGETPGKCARWATAAGGSFPSTGETVIDRVGNWQESLPSSRRVFTLGQGTAVSPKYISVRIEVPAKGERSAGNNATVILQDGFSPRNIS